MTDIEQTVEGYFDMWNETDAGRRRELIERIWTPVGSYVDPMFSADGYDELSEMVAGVHQQFPGHRFRLAGAVDTHHNMVRWGWELATPDGGGAVARGVDFAVLATDGRLGEVTGFIEAVSAVPAQ
jgi:hypothetical protein